MIAFWGYYNPPRSRKRKQCGCPWGSACNCGWLSTRSAVQASAAIEALSNEAESEEKPKIKVTYKMYPVAKCGRCIRIRNTRAFVKQFAPRRLQRFS